MARYLITFDVDTKLLEKLYHGNSYTNAYNDIKQVLKQYGFNGMQGSVYIGDEGVSEAHGTIAIQALTWKYPMWFNACVSNIMFFRIDSDLNAQFISNQMQDAINKSIERKQHLINKYLKMNLTQAQIDELIQENDLNVPEPTLIDYKK